MPYRELLDYLERLTDQKIIKQGNDIISTLIVEQLNPGHLEKLDVVQIAFLLLVAGNATMVSMICLVRTKATPGGTKLDFSQLIEFIHRV